MTSSDPPFPPQRDSLVPEKDLLAQLECELADSRSRLRRDLANSRPIEASSDEARLRTELAAEVESLQQQLAWTSERLVAARNTPFARLTRIAARIEDRIAPLGTRRRDATATIRTGFAVLVQEGTRAFASTFIRWLGGERGYWKRLIRSTRSPFFASAGPMPTRALLEISEPRPGDRVEPEAKISGWTVDSALGPGAGPGIDSVRVHLGSRATGRLLAETRPTLPRDDPKELLDLDESYEFCGFQIDLGELPGGTHFLTVCSVRNQRVVASVAISLRVDSRTVQPFQRPSIFGPAFRAFASRSEPSDRDLRRQSRETAQWSTRPSFDFISRAGGSTTDIEITFGSMAQQTYGDWRWHLETSSEHRAAVEDAVRRDPRVRIHSDSVAVTILPGDNEFVVPIRPGDRLAPNALHALASEIRFHPRAALVFSDEDKLDDKGRRADPFFKPCWSPELALSTNLVSGIAGFRRSLLQSSDTLSRLTDEVGAWDLSLRWDRSDFEIRHIPHLLIHRGAADPPDRSAIATMLADNLRRRGIIDPQISISTANGVRRPRIGWTPAVDRFVSVVIPSGTPDLAAQCITNLVRRTTVARFEVILVATDGRPEQWSRALNDLSDPRIQIVRQEPSAGGFNFQNACNVGRRRASGDTLLFLNDDVVVSDETWIRGLVQWLDFEGVGAVGPKLIYPDGSIQHAGVVVGMTGFASHVFRGELEDQPSLFGSNEWYRNCSALTAACLLVPSQIFDEVGGFDERFAILFGDVDLCLRIRKAGYRLVYTPDVRLLHEESRTRRRRSTEQIPRSDWELFSRLWLPMLAEGDPFYSPNLSSADEHPTFKRGDDDTPLERNQTWMARLPKRHLITLPDDLRPASSAETIRA